MSSVRSRGSLGRASGRGAHPGESSEKLGLASSADMDKVSGYTLISEGEEIYAYEYLPCLDTIHSFTQLILTKCVLCAK